VGLDEANEWAKVVYYGDPSTGKTTALAGMAHLGKVLFVDAESGLKKTALRRVGIPTENIERTTVRGFEDMQALIWELRDAFDKDPGHLIGVCVDSFSELEQVILTQVTQDKVDKASRRGVARDPFDNDESWQENSAKMRRILRDLRDLPCHVGFAALSRRDMDEEGVVFYRPANTPQVSNLLVASCDISIAMQPVWTQERGGDVHWGITKRSGKWYGKDRFGILPLRFPYPSFDRIAGYLAGELTAKTDPEVKAFRAIRAGREE
jgi:hypothetical protein